MRKAKHNHVPTQMSKISDFFSKIPNTETAKNGSCDNKRKFSDLRHPTQSTILNSVTNLPEKREQELSPNSKKMKHDENFLPPSTSVQEFKVLTPEKCLKPSSSMKTPTPKKSSGSSNSAGKSRTPQSSRKGTPKKLFEKSPRKLEEFNVQILEAFVKVSPSTSNRILTMKDSVKYGSPVISKRSSPAQTRNETTPSKLPKISSVTPKVKTKLNFLDNVDIVVKKENMDEENHKLSNGVKLEVDSFFEDDFDAMLSFEEELKTLDLSEAQYCTILEVNKSHDSVLLKLKSSKDGSIGLCSIEEFWASGNSFKVKDNVFISAVKSHNKWVVNNENGWLIYEPDLLIPCTFIVGSLFCKRKSILSDRFRGFDSSNRVMIIGILTHSLLQQALKKKLKTMQEIEGLLKNILESKDTMKRLYESSLTRVEIEAELQTFVPKLVTFISGYVDNNAFDQAGPGNWQGSICGIDDIEENLWCPELGIKGKIDVTVQTQAGVVPLELKTGRATVSLEHRGQVVLYIMMMNKFGYEVSSGLLLYLREGVLKEIKATPQEKRDVMILRNELAYFLTRTVSGKGVMNPFELPEPLNNHRACLKCPYNVVCTSLIRFEDYDISKNRMLQEVQKNATSHLTQAHLEYFLRWCNLLSMEDECNKGSKSIKQIYTTPPEKREAFGRCIINVKITSVGDDQNGLYEHAFEKENSEDNLAAYDITENNYVVVSTDSRPAVATGFVTDVSSSKITILLDRNLAKKYPSHFFHIDTYDSNITYTSNMTSLSLLLENTPRASELRNIIIDKNPPTFLSKLPSVVAKKGAVILKRLNIVQQKAVLKALCANEFLLIKGMPGTGKSATIVALIQILIELGKSVLITSHTHSAIDNICLRLQKRGVEFLRLGSESKINAEVKENSEATLTEKCTTPEEMEEVYNRYKVIAVTCLGSGHPLLSKRTVDVCIVDESTQVLQTSVFRPLYAAKTFILIGDPNQLAPLVKNRDAMAAGMSESLFERLENSDGTITLNLNYRMNKTITDLANVLTYQGQLKCASEEVANRTLEIPNMKLVKTCHQDHPWLLKAIDTSLDKAVQLIDSGPVWQSPEDIKWHLNSKLIGVSDTQNCLNFYEIAIVVMLVKALIQGGVPSSDIGVIATYRAQVTQMADILEKVDIDVSTVDQYQGRDKSVIIYSCTKSTDSAKVSTDTFRSELLDDKRRLTVAITRAKRKLLIVGDVSTLQRFGTFTAILPTLRSNIIKFDSPWSSVNKF